MNSTDFKKALETARNQLAHSVIELGETEQKAKELEERIGDLRRTVSVLSKLCGEPDVEMEDALGLTDAIRMAVRDTAPKVFTAQDVRLRLESRGFNTRRYGNLLASIHMVLKRLAKQGEFEIASASADRVTYRVRRQAVILPPMPDPVAIGIHTPPPDKKK